MFDFIRSHQKLMQILLLILIVPPFAFWGVDGYRKMGDATDSVAKVAGASITQLEFQNAQRQQLDRYRQMLGAQFDAKMLDNDQAREGLLDQIVNQRVLLDYSVRQHVSASDQKLRETIAALPALQRDGKFDAATYEARLIGQGLTKQRFEGQMRQDLGLQALSGSVQESGLASKALMTKILGVMEEEREIQEMVFKPSDFTAKVVLGPDAVKTYYEANKKEFAVPAQVKAEMVQLNAAALTASVKVTDDEIAKYFEANQKKFVQAEERQASHILIGAEKDNKDARAKAKTKAEEVLKAVRAAPDTFADMAKKESMDPGSGQNGGDLGYFGKGAMVPPFEAAAFSMKVNDISELVETDFGFHILRLTGVKEAKGKSLAEAKTEIDAELKKVAAATKLRESIEKFQTAAETADSMKSLADQFGLPVGTTAL